ncbi:SCO family protein [Echinicola strongylocentroti]|uniref:SCO family protein n=1 Tax=Echinicola strongylocentroti TaxID=1795355 RepID=A0A2Z4IKS5_9BACT|nr:SCO family protein [Echinicola strongylocentroti]AWW31545.1 SCO family protein [Echinicola strongylocentroti]
MKMIRVLQGLVLVCILMVPVLIILFLRNFGENTYEIPVLYENGVEDPFGDCNYSSQGQHYIPDFTFVSQDSVSIGRQDMEGKVTIVDFFFTSCPSICPTMSLEMERVQDAFRNEDLVQLYSISIDPDYDTPAVLKEYAQLHGATSGKWFFLNGKKELVYDLARCGFVLPTIDGNGVPEDFIHSDKLALIDKQGRIRGYYSGTNREDVDLLILETKILLHGQK